MGDMSKFSALIYQEEDVFVAECKEIGTVSQGKTREEALENLKEATELYLEEFPEKKPIPTFITTFTMAHA